MSTSKVEEFEDETAKPKLDASDASSLMAELNDEISKISTYTCNDQLLSSNTGDGIGTVNGTDEADYPAGTFNMDKKNLSDGFISDISSEPFLDSESEATAEGLISSSQAPNNFNFQAKSKQEGEMDVCESQDLCESYFTSTKEVQCTEESIDSEMNVDPNDPEERDLPGEDADVKDGSATGTQEKEQGSAVDVLSQNPESKPANSSPAEEQNVANGAQENATAKENSTEEANDLQEQLDCCRKRMEDSETESGEVKSEVEDGNSKTEETDNAKTESAVDDVPVPAEKEVDNTKDEEQQAGEKTQDHAPMEEKENEPVADEQREVLLSTEPGDESVEETVETTSTPESQEEEDPLKEQLDVFTLEKLSDAIDSIEESQKENSKHRKRGKDGSWLEVQECFVQLTRLTEQHCREAQIASIGCSVPHPAFRRCYVRLRCLAQAFGTLSQSRCFVLLDRLPSHMIPTATATTLQNGDDTALHADSPGRNNYSTRPKRQKTRRFISECE